MGTKGKYRLSKAFAACALLTMGVVGSPSRAAPQSATVRTVALRPLSIVKISDLEFGTMISAATAGTVVVNPATDVRTTTGGVAAAGGVPKAAQFLTYGTQNSVLQVTRGPLPVLSRAGGGATMNVTQLTLNGPVTRVVSPAGVLDLRVGGTLAVGANQLEGIYSGNFDITVTYF